MFGEFLKKLVKNILLVNIILGTIMFNSSCDRRIANSFINRPSNEFDGYLEDVSVEFEQGWRDGCETGMGSGGNTFYKAFYSNNIIDGYKYANSSDYKTAWGNAFWYCYRHDYIKHKSSTWGSVFGGYR